jgi:hypothetical protein
MPMDKVYLKMILKKIYKITTTYFAANVDRTNCLALNSGSTIGAMYERGKIIILFNSFQITGACYVLVYTPTPYATAKTSCNHLKNGYLGYLSEDDLVDKMIVAMVKLFKFAK